MVYIHIIKWMLRIIYMQNGLTFYPSDKIFWRCKWTESWFSNSIQFNSDFYHSGEAQHPIMSVTHTENKNINTWTNNPQTKPHTAVTIEQTTSSNKAHKSYWNFYRKEQSKRRFTPEYIGRREFSSVQFSSVQSSLLTFRLRAQSQFVKRHTHKWKHKYKDTGQIHDKQTQSKINLT